MNRGGRAGRGRAARGQAGFLDQQTELEEPASGGEEVENADTGGPHGTEGEGGAEPTIADLAEILRTYMGQQEVREARMKEDAARQEQRFRALQQQFQLLQDEVQILTNPVPSLPAESEPLESEAYDRPPAQARAPSSLENAHPADAFSGQSRFSLEPKLGKLTENDDVEHFLITFERIAVACRWPKSDWAFRLIPLLTGEARSAYVHMDIDESLDYEKVKSAILTKYDINPETYRQRFRSLEVKPGESPKELYCRLKELFGKWTQPKGKTVQEISEILILEQYLRMLSPELQVWIREHGPSSASEAAALADVFVAARKKSQPWSYNSWKAGKEARRPAPPQNHQRPAAGQKCNVAVTRARVKQPDEPSLTLSTLPFYGAELETKPGKSRKPRNQKRQEKFKGTVVKTSVEAAPELPLGFELPNNVIELQQSDSSLTTFLQRAKEKETKADTSTEEYFLQNGILYRQHGPVAQLVVPQAARDAVLTLGHAVPWAGHLGKHKTTARIKRYFHWPGLRFSQE
ncbi:zinc finger protein 202-like [Myripristis murdjan]|uniref:zinc finger protein 202-like n=1 Tax=Myripristis murdjan TaxID=586833 RepID=UPI0011762D05|nr:zinc finger protein 202-like [Myripristis murdjan]